MVEFVVAYLILALLPVAIAIHRRQPFPGWLALWSLATTITGIGWLGAMLYACTGAPLEEGC